MYEVIFLNKDLETEYRCKTVDYLWDSKLYEPGEFQIQIIADDDLDFDVCKYIITSTKKEIGLLERYELDSSSPGTVLISGYFMEQDLFRSVIYPTYEATGKDIWTIKNEICAKYLDNIGYDLTLPTMPSSGVIPDGAKQVSFQQTGDYVGTALYALASANGCGVAVTKNDTGLTVDITNYHDRTGETDDEEVVLSVSLNNIKKYDVIKDSSNYRNVAVVAGAGEGSARVFRIVDISKDGERKRHLWVDARDLQQETLSDEEQRKFPFKAYQQYLAKLNQRGLEKLAECVEIDNVEVEVDLETAERIGSDFDLGDIVWVAINPYNLIYKMKIIEVEDTFNAGQRSVSIVFGDKIPTPWEKVRTLYR